MPYSWDEVKQAVERDQDAQLERLFAEQEVADGLATGMTDILHKANPYLQNLGGVVVGLNVAVLTLAFNYMLFVWILHLNFDLMR